MSVIIMDGCQGSDAATKWSSGSTGTRNGSIAARLTGSASYTSGILIKNFTAASEVFTASAHIGNAATIGDVVFAGDSGATTHITVFRNTSGFIEARRGTTSGTLLATGATQIPDGVWNQRQIRVTISDTVGVVQVRLNGSSSYEINFSGDTKNGGTNSTIDRVTFQSQTAVQYSITDMVILDTNGSVNNTWPGDVRVQTLTPTGNGNTSQGVGSDSDSTNNYLLVDEQPFSATDYVGVTTDTQGDTYTLSDLATATNTVKAIQVNINCAKSDAGAKSVKRRVRSGGTTYAGSSQLLTTTYVTFVDVLENDPATSAAWTVAAVNALEAGFEAAP